MINKQQGSSLIEALLTIVIVALIVFLIANLPNAIGLINKSKHLSLAREIAAKQLEDKRVIKYVNLANNSSAISDSRLNLLPSGSGLVTVENCEAQICANNELTKQVTVKVSWQENGKTETITLRTLISKGGLNQ